MRQYGIFSSACVATIIIATTVLFTGCAGIPIPEETAARADFAGVAVRYRPGDAKPELPELTTESRLDDYLHFAIFNHPEIEAAYYDWFASIESVSVARSAPDPRLTFSADVTEFFKPVVAGLMIDLPGPGKLRAAGQAAAAGSQERYFLFESAILRTAYAVKSAYYRLKFLEDTIAIQQQNLKLLGELEDSARQIYSTGRTTLQDVLRVQIEQDQLTNRIDNLLDSRTALRAELKAALGLDSSDEDPPVPIQFDESGESPDEEKIFEQALQRNPAIQRMKAEVYRAGAMIKLARKAGVPDFSLGMEAGFTSGPTMLTPSASITLPVWRDKIAAQIASAQAVERAADARLSTEKILLATDLATMLFTYSESVRNVEFLENLLIPKGQQSLQAAHAGYASGKTSFLDVIDSYRQLTGFDLSLVEARTQRELALSYLSLLIAGVPPQGSPVMITDQSADGSGSETESETASESEKATETATETESEKVTETVTDKGSERVTE